MVKLKHLFVLVLLNLHYPVSSRSHSGDSEVHIQSGRAVRSGIGTEIDTGKSVQNQAEDKINELRQRHGVPKVVLDKELCTSAQNHAEKIAAAGKVSMSCTRDDCIYGENVGMGPPNVKIAIELKTTIQRWYNTGAKYDYKKTNNGKDTKVPGTFTQLIWKDSKRIGIGVVVSKVNNHIFLVVQFLPSGNIQGEFLKNVHPPIRAAGAAGRRNTKAKGKGRSAAGNPKSDAGAASTTPKVFAASTVDPAVPAPLSKRSDSENNSTNKLLLAAGYHNDTIGATPGGNHRAYQSQILDYINELRFKHHAPKLKLEKTLTETAQIGSEISAELGKMTYTCEGDACAYGENQGMRAANEDMVLGVKAVVDLWYAEEAWYNYATGKEVAGKAFPGAFTALVWKGSTKVGIGAKISDDGKLYVIVTFKPPGNVGGTFLENVLKS